MGLVVDSKVRQLGLDTDGDLLADVGHLESFLPKIPLVPAIVGLDMLLNKVGRCLHALVDHQRCGD